MEKVKLAAGLGLWEGAKEPVVSIFPINQGAV